MMNKAIVCCLICLCLGFKMNAQTSEDDLKHWLLGRWEVTAYSEQGVQVNKKQNALPQAIKVWRHVRKERAITWYGYDEDWSERKPRRYEDWELRDSAREVNRLVDAISTPYYAVFFPDSTVAMYNKDAETNLVFFPDARHYEFSPKSMSIRIYQSAGYRGVPQWNAQVLQLTEDRMTLFLPEEGEMVELVKTNYSIP